MKLLTEHEAGYVSRNQRNRKKIDDGGSRIEDSVAAVDVYSNKGYRIIVRVPGKLAEPIIDPTETGKQTFGQTKYVIF
jgi:hypothetical protein